MLKFVPCTNPCTTMTKYFNLLNLKEYFLYLSLTEIKMSLKALPREIWKSTLEFTDEYKDRY